MLVASTTRRRPPGSRTSAARWCAGSIWPWRRWTTASRLPNRSAVRSISATPGRKARRSPGASRSACRIAPAIASSIRCSPARPRWTRSSGWPSPLALDHRSIAHQLREPRAVERRRHRHQPQVGPQRALDIEREGEAGIAVEAALVNLVEQHRRDAGELRVGLDARDEDAFCQHRQPGRGRLLAVHPRGVADRAADRLTPASPRSARRRRGRRGGGGRGAAPRRCTTARRAARARPRSSCPRPAARPARGSVPPAMRPGLRAARSGSEAAPSDSSMARIAARATLGAPIRNRGIMT